MRYYIAELLATIMMFERSKVRPSSVENPILVCIPKCVYVKGEDT